MARTDPQTRHAPRLHAIGPPPGALHLVDTTMFWAAQSGGVRSYLEAKRRWIGGGSIWRHTIAAPVVDGPGMVGLPAPALPFSNGYRWPLRRSLLAGRLADLAPDLIESGDPYTLAWASADAAQRCGVPAVAFCHSNLDRMAVTWFPGVLGRMAGRQARRYAARLYNEFDLVLAPSASMRAHLLDWGVLRVERQPLGVDTAAFHPSRARGDWRRQLGIPDGHRVVVYAGRFSREKHLQMLANAVERLGRRHLLLAIGDGPVPPRGPNVRRLPFLRDRHALATALASADAFVHAGDQETFGLSVLEALACGTPVVARAREGLAELVDDSVGMAVEQGSAAAFAQAIDAVLSTGRPTLSRNARLRAERHDWAKVFNGLEGRYLRLLRRPTAGMPSLRAVTES